MMAKVPNLKCHNIAVKTPLISCYFSLKNRELNSEHLRTRQRAVMALCDILHDPEFVNASIKIGKSKFSCFSYLHPHFFNICSVCMHVCDGIYLM